MVVEFSFVSESDTLVFAGDTWALPMQIRRRKTAELASAPDEERHSGEAPSGLASCCFGRRMRQFGIELGNCLVVGRDAPARSCGCVSLAITKIVLDSSRA